LNRTLTLVGRSPECQITLTEHGLSPFHCSLFCTGGGVWAVDLLGTGGMDVNGKRMRWSHLHDGDDVRVGRASFRFRHGSALNAGSDLHFRAMTVAPEMVPTVQWAQPQVHPWGYSVDTTLQTWLSRALGPGQPVLQERAEHFVRLVVEQFDSLLQVMRAQIRRTMMEMDQALSVMHQDRVQLLRPECERVRRLVDEALALADRAPQVGARERVTPQVARLDREPGCGEHAPTPSQPCPNPRSNASSSRMCEA
jgi:hypothetical protein